MEVRGGGGSRSSGSLQLAKNNIRFCIFVEIRISQMATIIPFKGIRPVKDKVHLVASRSADAYNARDLHEKLATNPYSFLHIINPDFGDREKTRPGSAERLKKVKAKYLEFLREGLFVSDTKPCYYIYRQIKEDNIYTGIIACTSIDDYYNGVIKIHEQTLTEREKKLKDYLDVCNFNAEPVLFGYPDDRVVNDTVAQLVTAEPAYDFTTTDRVTHRLWILDQEEKVKLIRERFKETKAVYIADGHHRSASSALLGVSRRMYNKNHTGKEPYNFYLGVFFPESQLKIYDFNRVVKDLNGLSENGFIQKLTEKFEITEKGTAIYKADKRHYLSMYLNGKWYALKFKEGLYDDNSPIESLDAHLLTRHLLSPILNISDLKTDKRISFVSGIKGMEELKKLVDEGLYKVAFGLFPVSIQQLKNIADTNNIMPPKSTWVEPKMRSGLVIYSLSE